MKKIFCVFALAVAVVFILGVAVIPCGCESSQGTDGLTITPASVTLTESNLTQWFEVSLAVSNGTLSPLPIEWSVTDPSLGNIINSSGYTVLYERTGKEGENKLIARDQLKNEGFAAIKQVDFQYGLTLSASANPIPAGTNTTTITVSGGVAPFDWWVNNLGKGTIISGDGSDTVIYKSKTTGANVVHAEDANGVLGTIAITQQ